MAKRKMNKDDQPKDDEKLEGVETELRPDGAERQQSFSNPLPSSHFSSPAGIPEVSDDVPSDAELLGWGDEDEDNEEDDEQDEQDDEQDDEQPKKSRTARKEVGKETRQEGEIGRKGGDTKR